MNSPLVTLTRLSPNRNSPRNHAIDRVTVHCTAAQCTANRLGDIFANPNAQKSCNYAISKDGEIVLIVDENDRSWASSSRENDHRAITIEVSSDSVDPYAVTDKAYNALIELLVDIGKRHGFKKFVWIPDKATALAYEPKPTECLMTVHRWFANKACPGAYLLSKHPEIAETVTSRLNTGSQTKVRYAVQVASFSDKAKAIAYRDKLRKAGYPEAYVTRKEITS